MMTVTLSPHPLVADLVPAGTKAECCKTCTQRMLDAQQSIQRPAMMYLPFLLRRTKTPLTLHIPTAFDSTPT